MDRNSTPSWPGHTAEADAGPDPAFLTFEPRRSRHDGWTPERMRVFHECLAESGVVAQACEAAGMSARSAYSLRARDPLFAAGWEAAAVQARARLADEAMARSLNGVVDRIYRDGELVAERHRHDNRLTMAVLARLDSRIDRAVERGDPHLALAARWDDYLDALGEGRREDGLALIASLAGNARDRELRELCDEGRPGMEEDETRENEDPHLVWHEDGTWWTDYPPPARFDGDERGFYGEPEFCRTLTAAELAAVEAEEAVARTRGEAQRDAYFFGGEPPQDSEPGAPSAA